MALLDIGSEDAVRVGDQFALGPQPPPPAGAAGRIPAAAKAEVTEVQPLSCVVKVSGDAAAGLKENQEVHRVPPIADKPAPPAPPTADKPAPPLPPPAPAAPTAAAPTAADKPVPPPPAKSGE
jgi:hypothetical protein